MIEKTRSFFEDSEARGGSYEEIVIDGVGHTPQVEAPERFERTYIDFLKRNE